MTEEHAKRLVYLKQAFCGFFQAKQAVEMENLGRVICAILEANPDEKHAIMDGIATITPLKTATSTLESFTSTFSSLFE